MIPQTMIISEEEWRKMHREWLANCEAYLAQHDPFTPTLNPYTYTTLSDGRHHPCDNPHITPKEFLLATVRDVAIPFDLRIWAAKQFIELYPEHNLSFDDYKVACEMLEWITSQRDPSKMN